METRTFLVDSYLSPDEWFHFARRRLDPVSPAFAHDHDYHELLMIVGGAASHWIGGTTEELVAGDLVCLRPRDAHALRASRAAGCEIVNIMFRSEVARHFAARYPEETAGRFFWREGAVPHRLHLSGARFDRALALVQELASARRSLARIEEALLALVNRIAETPDRLEGVAPAWLVSACAAARSEAVYRRGGAGLVAAAGRSHEHVCRAMKRHLGTTPSAYVNGIRMEQAARLLDGTDLSIAEVAALVGLENLGHFYRLFGRQHGTTPRAWRLQHQRDPIGAA